VSELVFGKDVKLRPHTFDRYGRLIARVIIDNQDAGLELLKQGLCWVYEKYVGEAPPEIQTSYRDAQDTAQVERAGLWQGPDRCRHGSGAKRTCEAASGKFASTP
jgi:endonuclease YncB( thermonuclease family)